MSCWPGWPGGAAAGRAPARQHWSIPTADFEVTRWLADLDADHAMLADLLTAVRASRPTTTISCNACALPGRTGGSAGKVLIFSEAEATVRYLYEQLNPGGADPTIAMLSGANRDQPAEHRQALRSRGKPEAARRRCPAPRCAC